MARDIGWFRHVDSLSTITDPCYTHSLVKTITNGGATNSLIYFLPFNTGRGGTFKSIGPALTSAPNSGAVGLVGIYARRSETDILPGTLLLNCGSIGLFASGYQTASINYVAPPNDLLWFAFICTSTSVLFRVPNNTGLMYDQLGVAAGDDNMRTGVTVPGSLTNGLPSTVSNSFAFTDTPPLIYVKYSA